MHVYNACVYIYMYISAYMYIYIYICTHIMRARHTPLMFSRLAVSPAYYKERDEEEEDEKED